MVESRERLHVAEAPDAAGAVARPLLSGLYHVVPAGPDRVQVCNAGRSVVFTGPRFSERLPPMLAALDGTRTIDELTESFPELMSALLDGLRAKGLLLDAAPNGAGQSAALWTTMALPGAPAPAETNARLREATVAIAGAGPVALATALLIAKAGVGALAVEHTSRMTAADVVACPAMGAGAVGRSPHRALRNALASVAETVVRRADDLLGADLVLVEQRYTDSGLLPPVADAALAAGVAYLVHGQDALEATIGPSVRRGGRPCHRCAETRRQSNVAHIKEHRAYLAQRAAEAAEPDAFLAAHTSIVAGYVATEVLRGLLGVASDASVLTVDLATATAQHQPVLALPGCAGCATAPA